ncbi:SRPBCC domain-containing protein [Streptomyces sp. NBC_01017]|uniref:SRPBCC domain-containing protein n=1 Tax=Streptomyces sp. NBC_01017 TaxID=2903721 RepID=UPI00386E0FB3|nr:SRPBCC domain-containing protein [Streptomyces sp. NBC_01017]
MRRVAAVLAAVSSLLLLSAPSGAAAGTSDGLDPRVPSAHSVIYREQAVIATPPEHIWQLITDLPGYSSWNPWVVRADGTLARGATVNVDVVLGSHTMHAQHTVLVVEKNTRLCWRDAGWNALLVYGQRCRTLQQQPDGSVLYTSELLLDGPLASVTDFTIGKHMRAGMAAETAALKRHAAHIG